MDGLKNLLMVTATDSTKIAHFKILFKEIGIVFIKYFAINWIFGGRLRYKLPHVQYRYKMLRRVTHPE